MPTAPPMAKPRIMGIDIETFSSAPLPKCGVYRYADAPDFTILLFSYAFDDDPVVTIDLACGEELPQDVVSALGDHNTLKFAYNTQFERVCLSKHLGHWLDPHQWRCTAVWAAYSIMPARLADAAVALGVNEKKMEEGKDLIRYFSVPCKVTKVNGGRFGLFGASVPTGQGADRAGKSRIRRPAQAMAGGPGHSHGIPCQEDRAGEGENHGGHCRRAAVPAAGTVQDQREEI